MSIQPHLSFIMPGRVAMMADDVATGSGMGSAEGKMEVMAEASRVTLKDIAQRLGLSTATVSRSLSDTGEHRDQTVRLVKETAKEMGYIRNTAAADLVQGKSHALAVILSNTKTNFDSSIIEGIEQSAAERNLDVLILHAGNADLQAQRRAITTAVERAVRGIILVSLELQDSLIATIEQVGMDCISLSSFVGGGRLPCITSDDYQMGYEATQFLIDQGHRRIGLAGIPKHGSITLRISGYRQCLEDNSIPYRESLVFRGGCLYQDGIAAMKRCLKTKEQITALIGASDLVAMGAINQARDQGLDVPGDVSVMSFDGTDIVEMVRPTITSVTQAFYRMGVEGVKALLSGDKPGSRFLPFRIISRQSTGPGPCLHGDHK